MNKLLEVKEFDKIICNPEYKNNTYYKFLEKQYFTELVDFIYEFEATEENSDALDCFSIKPVRGVGKVITVKNYVGLIQMKSGFQIQILPKIAMKNESEDVTKITFLKMLRTLDNFKSKVFNTSNLNTDKMNLYEIFINMYLQEVNNLVKKGVKSTYVTNSENLETIKGKLNIKEHIKRNIIHKEKFYCCYDEYQINRSENKLIKTTLLILNKTTERIENKKLINKLLMYFEGVDISYNYEYDFSKIAINRSKENYALLMQWSKIFLKNKSFSTFSGESVAKALLFSMDKVFECYVAKYIKKYFNECVVSTQDTGYYLFDNPEKFALRPDIVITKNDGTKIVMDTKWKKLCNNSRKNYGILPADMYQMYAYSKKYKAKEIWMLYPMNEEMIKHENINFKSEDDVNVNIFFIDVTNMEKSMENLKNKVGGIEK